MLCSKGLICWWHRIDQSSGLISLRQGKIGQLLCSTCCVRVFWLVARLCLPWRMPILSHVQCLLARCYAHHYCALIFRAFYSTTKSKCSCSEKSPYQKIVGNLEQKNSSNQSGDLLFVTYVDGTVIRYFFTGFVDQSCSHIPVHLFFITFIFS